ncbi:MAG: hypothetical protein AAF555_06170 [Verrucomicrobiota bacterium]
MNRLFLPLLFPLSLLAQEPQPMTEVDRERALERLAKLENSFFDSTNDRMRSAYQAFSAASRSNVLAYAFFMEAYKEVNFVRKDRPLVEYGEWRRANSDKFKERAQSTGFQMQLKFLMLAIESTYTSREDMLPKIEAFLAEVVAISAEVTGVTRHLRQDPIKSVFVELYHLHDLKPDPFGKNPIDLGGFYEKVILDHYRQENQSLAALREAWERRLTLHVRMARSEELLLRYEDRQERNNLGDGGNGNNSNNQEEPTEGQEKFLSDAYPKLRWAMAQDLYKKGDVRKQIAAMFEIAERNRGHEDVDEWLAQLRKHLQPEEPETVETPEEALLEASL